MDFIANQPFTKIFSEPAQSEQSLYQLSGSGDWIRLRDVVGVRLCRGKGGLPPLVVVHTESGRQYQIVCETDEQAREVRDRIAADRNALPPPAGDGLRK